MSPVVKANPGRKISSLTSLPLGVLARIFALTEQPQNLAVSCKRFVWLSLSPAVRVHWVLEHWSRVASWAWEVAGTDDSVDEKESQSNPLGHWFAATDATRTQKIPASLLICDATCILLLNLLERVFVISEVDEDDENDQNLAKSGVSHIRLPRSIKEDPKTCSVVIRAIWSAICANLHIDVIGDTLETLAGIPPADSSLVRSSLNAKAWKEALYAGIMVFSETKDTLRTVLKTYPIIDRAAGGPANDFSEIAPQALVLAAHVGDLSCIVELVEGPKSSNSNNTGPTSAQNGSWDIGISAADMLRVAANAGCWPIVLYVVGRSGFADRHKDLVSTYRGLYLLGQSAEKGNYELVNPVLENWRAEDANRPADLEGNDGPGGSCRVMSFAIRWSLSVEMAAESGRCALIKKLIECRTRDEVDSGQFKVTVRMFALAVGRNHFDAAEILLNARAMDDDIMSDGGARVDGHPKNKLGDALVRSGSGSTDLVSRSATVSMDFSTLDDIFMGNVTGSSAERRILLLRYCGIPAELLAPQLGLEVTMAKSNSIKNINDPGSGQQPLAHWQWATEKHRIEAVRFLIENSPNPLPMRPPHGDDALWAAFKAGNIDLARIIKEAGGRVGWMESATGNGLHTPDIPNTPGNGYLTPIFTAGSFGTSVPQPAAMALFFALGGGYSGNNHSNDVVEPVRRGNSAAVVDLGALLIAAEASRMNSALMGKNQTVAGKKFSIEDFESASSKLSRDSSFLLDQLSTVPYSSSESGAAYRQLVSVDDNLWTAFLAGKLEETSASVSAESESTLSWMEPARTKYNSFGRRSSGFNTRSGSTEFGQDFDEEAMQVYLGLGGKMPEKSAISKPTILKSKAMQRIIKDF